MRARMRGGAPWGGPEGPGGPFEFGMRGGPFGPPKFGGRGPRVRRGDVRAAILDLLAEGQPWNGYQIIQEIGARTEGVWRPSAGSVYPALQQLEDEALITAQAAGEDRRRMYTLTEEGQAYVTEHADELRASWDAGRPGGLGGPGAAGGQDPR
jgi:DNA-binding PadR family transcriptional regulator